MTMNILLIEDDSYFLDLVTPIIESSVPGVTLFFAESRDSAIWLLENEYFDLIILDLNLPAQDGDLEISVEHGRFVFEQISLMAPGTPVLILTGSSAEPFISDFLAHSTQVDIWGDGAKIPTVNFVKKSDLDRLGTILESANTSVRAIRDVEG